RVVGHFRLDGSARQPFRGLDLLDIGCGGGLLSEPMRRLGAAVTGIDAAEQNVRVAGVHAAQSGLDIDYRCVLPEVLAGEGPRFDVVLNMEVVEHVADLDAFHEACCTLVKPGGVMVVSTINRTLKSLALAKVGAEYVLRWIPPGTHDWRKFVRPSELAAGLRAHGVEIVALKGMTYGPLRDDWYLSSDLAVNYLAFAVKG
ncbi:MAG: bifunctional 2-polyprenyl-6-hydroxyphenol methylase/3-demethylubiquinol 3-O-methyltransferase UbiG, partial [Proteobacteria bacterium]|nr:bifunctional 2-polyprenyl-6-hydroxyphenol methylase/3-demethylubiquinol 3-O-methyltransferase UbiG [Pseudomonadota bacterium]